MKPIDRKQNLRCAIYTRVSTEHGLEQEFNSLDNQREASEAYIKSQAHEGWRLIRDRYDDGGFSGGSMDRPALQKLLDDVRRAKGRCDRRLQGRSADAFPRRLRQARRALRRPRRVLCLGDPSLQHHHQHGSVDPQHAAVLRPVRARGHGRAHPGQDRRVEEARAFGWAGSSRSAIASRAVRCILSKNTQTSFATSSDAISRSAAWFG